MTGQSQAMLTALEPPVQALLQAFAELQRGWCRRWFDLGRLEAASGLKRPVLLSLLTLLVLRGQAATRRMNGERQWTLNAKS